MAFTNRIRLPFKLHKPQFQEESERYRKANGETVTLSVVIRKIYEGITDEMPEKLHERLKIALAHDNVVVEGDKYVGVIAQDGDYSIEWSDFLSRPIAQAKFKAEVTPFNASNSNCGTCEQYTQVVAEDDDLGTVNEGDTLTFDPLANDSICCNPVTLSLVTVNSDYVTSASINPVTNFLTLVLKSSLSSVTGALLATYRAQCANGMYDEANIIANIDGSGPAVCNPPTGLTIDDVTDTTVTASWTPPTPAPADGYYWEIRPLLNLGVIEQSNVTPVPSAFAVGLTPSRAYRFYVRSDCGATDSGFVYVDFITLPPSGSDYCGQYSLTNANIAAVGSATYIDCVGNEQTVSVPPLGVVYICALQSSPGSPVVLNTTSLVIPFYVGLC